MKKKILTALLAAGMVAGSVMTTPAKADSGQTQLLLTKNSYYTMTVPATTTVTNYGDTALVNGLNVTGSIGAAEAVVVTVDSGADGFQFVHQTKADKTIPYTLKNGNDAYPTAGLSFTADEIGKDGGETKALSASVTQADWNAAPSGNYSDMVTFTAELKK